MLDEDRHFCAVIMPLLVSKEQQRQFYHLVRKVVGILRGGDRVDEERLDETRDDVPPGRIVDGG